MPTRATIVEKVKATLKDLRSGRYHPLRGSVNWATFPFETRSFPVSIVMPEDFDNGRANATTLSLIFMKRMIDRRAAEEIDEGALEEFRDDANIIADRLVEATEEGSGDSLFLGVVRNPTLELADSTSEIVGISASYLLEY